MGKLKSAALIVLLCLSSGVCAGNKLESMLRSYADGNYAKARSLAKQMPEKPEARLVAALCMIFDPVRQNISGGMAELEKLCENKSLPLPVWSRAALSYGRVAQLAQERKEVYGNAGASVDANKLFQEIIEKSPNSRQACSALFFEMTGKFESEDGKKLDAAFARLEKFCREFKGKPEYLTPLHLLAEQKYIFIKGDYRAAARHLIQARSAGIANPINTEIALYRIGRIYDLKLHKPGKAGKYYSEFLKKYPESRYAPAVKRFLKKLNP